MAGQNRSEAIRHPSVTAADLLAWSHENQAHSHWLDFVVATAGPYPDETPAAAVLCAIPIEQRGDFVWLMDRLTQDGRDREIRLKRRYAVGWKAAYAMFAAALKETHSATLQDIGVRWMSITERNDRRDRRERELERVWAHLVVGQVHAACVLLRFSKWMQVHEAHHGPVMATGPR